MVIDKNEVMAEIKEAVSKFSHKRMADRINKNEHTFYNELKELDYAKLGFRTAMSIIEAALEPKSPELSRAAAIRALDLLEEGCGRIAYNMPNPTVTSSATLRLISDFLSASSKNLSALADAIDDGVWEPKEVKRCQEENQKVMRTCLEISSHLTCIQKQLELNGTYKESSCTT